MTRKCKSAQPPPSLQERLTRFTQEARAAAKSLTVGAERHDLLQKARDGEAAAKIDRWLSSPGLRPPK